MKILITGSAGFIGYHLTKKLLERDDEVIGVDNINDYYDTSLKYARLAELGIVKNDVEDNRFTNSLTFPNLKFIKLDLTDTKNINKLFISEKFDLVCHLAAHAGVEYSNDNPHSCIQSNIVGFINILEACRHNSIRNVVYASSSSVYGLNQSQSYKTTDATDHPMSLYAATKKSNEMMAHVYSHLYNIQTIGLRFFTVYGPWGRPDMAPSLFADAIFNDRIIKVFNHGNMSRDFTYIDDIVDGIVKVIDNPAKMMSDVFDAYSPNPSILNAAYRIYNIGNNVSVNLLDFIEMLEVAIGKKAKKNLMSKYHWDPVSTCANVDSLINDFNYKPATSLSDGIREFISWYKKYFNK